MGSGSWALYLVLTIVAAGLVLWLYFRMEPSGRGRGLLAALRIAAFALVLLLLFDPALPGGSGPGGARRVQVLLDASASMALPEAPGSTKTRWDAAVQEAKRRGGTPLLFGDAPRPVPLDSLPDRAPADASSRLLPALQAAAETGAERVVVITDAAVQDASALGGWLARLGLGIEWVRVGRDLPGAGIAAVQAPAWAKAGETTELEVTVVAAAGTSPDSVRVTVRQRGRPIGEAVAASPPPGRSSTLRIPVRPTGLAEGGYERLEAQLEPADDVSADNRRVTSVFVSAEPAGVAVVSLRPDQEPRFLLPVLARALGTPVRGYLRAGTAGWVRVADGREAGRRITEGEVARAAAAADLVVLHGVGGEAPPWVLELLRGAPRLLVLPASDAGALPLPVELPAPVTADWFVAPDVPPSPVAELLVGAPTPDATPLPSLRPLLLPEGAWAPLRATRGRGGQPSPLVVGGQAGGRRYAVALAQGYWRWAFRGDASRALYDMFWSAVAGWLLQDQAGGAGGVRPVRRVLEAGERSAWVAAGLRPDSLRLRVLAGQRVALDTMLRAIDGDTVRAPALPPGEYGWRATAFGGTRAVSGVGQLEVEAYSTELTRPVLTLDDVTGSRAIRSASGSRGAPRPLHASPVPYLLIVLLLAAEWILRRRWGLR